MSVVPYDKELEALEEEERKVDLEITKQEKSQQIAEKRRKLEELSSAGSSSSTAAVPTVTRTATLTVKTSKYHEHGESRTTEKSAGLTAKLSKDLEVGYKERSAKAVEIQWKQSDDRVGTLPFNLDQPAGSSSIDPTQAFLSAMGITSEEINRLKKK